MSARPQNKPLILTTTAQFSRWVAARRKDYDISQRKLLKLAGLSHSTLQRVSEKSDIGLSTVALLAYVFGYRIALVPFDPDMSTVDDDINENAPHNGGASGERDETVSDEAKD